MESKNWKGKTTSHLLKSFFGKFKQDTGFRREKEENKEFIHLSVLKTIM